LIRLKFDRTSDSILPRKSKMLIVEKDKYSPVVSSSPMVYVFLKLVVVLSLSES
jgi:hypothetical protein